MFGFSNIHQVRISVNNTDSIGEIIFIDAAHPDLTLCVNPAVNPETDHKQKKSNVLSMSTTHIFISLQILLLSKETAQRCQNGDVRKTLFLTLLSSVSFSA